MQFQCKLMNSLIVALIFAYNTFLSSQESVTEDDELTSDTQTDTVPSKPRFLPPLLENQPCYPEGANGATQYLIGYGSLMNKKSKDGSYPGTGESVPIRIYGFTRSWTCKGESVSFSTTYLGTDVSENKSAYFNAVFFKVPNAAAIQIYDTREKFYCREEVPLSKMQLLTNKTSARSSLPAGQYWLYVTRPEYREVPSEEYPIVESYVDTFLSGCIELEEKYNMTGFAEECVLTTTDWEAPWKNDRLFPRRSFAHFPMAGKVDRLLNKTVHSAYKSIVIEG